jgi:hypothetical protein
MRSPKERFAPSWRRSHPATGSVAALLALLLAAAPSVSARADEPRSTTEPRVMREPGEVVDVIDAFDDGDPFDVSVSLGFNYSTKSAKVLRETTIAQAGLTTGGFTSNQMNVAEYTETTSRLIPEVHIGIYKDLAAYLRLPIILNNSRRLESLDSSGDRLGIVFAGAPGETLVTSLPFEAPDRSGVEYLAVGLEYDILNQARDRTKPTWLVGIEGRFSVGEPMHACNPASPAGQVECADPGDIDRNGQRNDDLESANAGNAREPGVTRGTAALEIRTILSRRVKYIEPYGGFSALFEFPLESSDYGLSDFEGSLVNHPPVVGTMIFGMMIIPWENREKFGRLTFDLRFTGEYRSEGRDYSELFDALGSSAAPTLRNPQFAEYTGNDAGGPGQPTSIVDEGSEKVYFTGLTDVQAYGSYRASASATWQASQYVKFTAGVGFRHDQAHGISGDQPCNPDNKSSAEAAGPCKSGDETLGEPITATGQPNPNYRPSINAVGRRFGVDDSNTFDVFASGVVMF